jgi:hypothetical protein
MSVRRYALEPSGEARFWLSEVTLLFRRAVPLGAADLAELLLSRHNVAGSNPVSRSTCPAVPDPHSMRFEFAGELWYWRGPSPFRFITVPAEACVQLRAMASLVSYGWGMIPVKVRIGGAQWDTSLFPKDGRYIVPIKDAVRASEGIEEGDIVEVELAVRSGPVSR